MTVINKYRPVPQTPSNTTPPRKVLPGALVAALLVGLFSGPGLKTWSQYEEDLSPTERSVIDGFLALSESSGLMGLREGFDAIASPLDRTSMILRPALPMDNLDIGGALTEDMETEEVLPPGVRWDMSPLQQRPQRILIVGASSIQYAVGTELQRVMEERYQDITLHRKGKVSTGLTRPDVFDWPAELDRLLDEHRPDVVIGQFGGNDAQNILSEDGPQKVGTEGWATEYTKRINVIAEKAKAAGALPILVGMPVMRSSGFNSRMGKVNQITKDAIEAAGGRYIPIADLSTDAKGKYTASVRFEGRSGRMRMDDGIHFTRLGGQFIAHHLARRVEREILLFPVDPNAPDPAEEEPKEPSNVAITSPEGLEGPPEPEQVEEVVIQAPPIPTGPAPSYRITVESETRGDTPALAYIPHEVPDEGLPVWYLLHGAQGSWTDWPEHAHDTLQVLADEHEMIIVVPDGEAYGWYVDSPVDPTHALATWLTTDLITSVEAQLPANGTRAISGNSMGGHGALTAAMTHTDLFAAVSSMSGVVDLPHAASRKQLQELLGTYEAAPQEWEARSALHLMRENPRRLDGIPVLLSCGDRDLWYEPNLIFHQMLEALQVDHEWVGQRGGHTWSVWTEALPTHADFIAGAFYPSPMAAAAPAEPSATDADPTAD